MLRGRKNHDGCFSLRPSTSVIAASGRMDLYLSQSLRPREILAVLRGRKDHDRCFSLRPWEQSVVITAFLSSNLIFMIKKNRSIHPFFYKTLIHTPKQPDETILFVRQ